MPAPTKYPDWATDGTNTVEPPAGKVAAGWVPAEQPPAGWFNWWQNLVGQWSRWLEIRIGEVQAELDAYEGSVDARAAFKDEANTFTQPQLITGADGINVGLKVIHEISANGHIGTNNGSFYALGLGGSIHLNADVDAGNNVLAAVNVQADTGDFKYKTAKSRTTFVPIWSGFGAAGINGAGGGQPAGTAGYNLKFYNNNSPHVFPICLPQGAVLTQLQVLVKLIGGATMTVQLLHRYNHNFEQALTTGGTVAVAQGLLAETTWGLAGVFALTLSGSIAIDNHAEDGSPGNEYLLSILGNANDEIHAIRVVWTDPGPRNF